MTSTLEVRVRREPSTWETLGSPAWLPYVQERIEAVAVGGWRDGRATEPLAHSAIKNALLVLQETMSDDTIPPQTVPGSDGGLQLEWHHHGVDLEVYVDASGTVSAWCREGSREWEDDYYSPARISKELSRLTAIPV